MFCSRIKGKLKTALQHFDAYLDAHIDTALKVTTALKSILSSPIADIITALIPGNIDNILKEQLLFAITKAVEALSIADACKQYAAPEDKLKCFVEELKKRDPQLQDAILQKLASLISAQLHGKQLKQYLYDLYTQAKYTVSK